MSFRMPTTDTIHIGIDPGTHRIGFGVVSVRGDRLDPVEYGVIENTGTDRVAHMRHVESGLESLVARWSPSSVGVERLFFSTNRKTAMAVGEMRGVILATVSRLDVPVREFTPLEIKRMVCGYGKADKAQVQRMVRTILRIAEPIRPDDAADALAIALCCCTSPLS